MTSSIVHRSALIDMGIRKSDETGRTIFGVAVPFNTRVPIWDWDDGEYEEDFERGAFATTIAERGDKVKLLSQHDRHSQLPLGRATSLKETDDGLMAEFRVSSTPRGDEVLELVRDGALDSFSIGFIPIAKRVAITDGVKRVTRTEVSLREVSVVTFPAYETATIDGARCEADARQALDDALRTGRPLSAVERAAFDALRPSERQEDDLDDDQLDDEDVEATILFNASPNAVAGRKLAILRSGF